MTTWSSKVKPETRQLIVLGLGSIVVIAIGAEIFLAWLGHDTSEALLAVASTATGALAGGLIPQEKADD